MPSRGGFMYWLKCNRCGYSWCRTAIPQDTPGLADAITRRQVQALTVHQPQVLPELSRHEDYQAVYEAAMNLPTEQLAGLMLALSASAAQRLMHNQ